MNPYSIICWRCNYHKARPPDPELIESAGKLSQEDAEKKLEAFMQVTKISGRHKLVMSYVELIPPGNLVEIARDLANRAKK